jgi:hypothetical protein
MMMMMMTMMMMKIVLIAMMMMKQTAHLVSMRRCPARLIRPIHVCYLMCFPHTRSY